MTYDDRTVATTLLSTAIKLLDTGRNAAEIEAKALIAKASGYIEPAADSVNCESLSSKSVTDVAGLREHFVDANAKFATEAVHPDDTIIAKTRLEYLEEVEREIVRLATLIHLHEKSFAIGAKGATNELGNEISAIIVKHNRA